MIRVEYDAAHKPIAPCMLYVEMGKKRRGWAMRYQPLRANAPRKLPLLWQGANSGQKAGRPRVNRGIRNKKRFFLGYLVMAVFFQPALAQALLVDNFERHGALNMLGNPANSFAQGPSKLLAARRWIPEGRGAGGEVLMLRYAKQVRGGPGDAGGWCGYYTLLKTPGRAGIPDQYLDGSKYRAITFWIRGQRGDENFIVGLVDRYWDEAGGSDQAKGIGAYLPDGKVTREWQRANIPLDEFVVDFDHLASIVFMFQGAGTVYIDGIALE